MLKDISIGYTTSENKLNQLKTGEFERFVFRNIKKAEKYENLQKSLNLVLIALFYSKCKGGTKID